MTGVDLHRWQSLISDGSAQWLKYSFGPGTANSLAVLMPDQTWMVISPATNMPEAAYRDLEGTAPVRALVAPNPYHNMGQAAWRTRFPQALSYAPGAAFARLAKKTPTIDYLPIEDLAMQHGALSFIVPDGMKVPDLLVRVATEHHCIWWMGDQFSNSDASDQIWLLRFIARFVGSGLGYRCNSKPELVYVRDRAIWIDAIRAALDRAPPTIVVPAHGNPVTRDTAVRTAAALAAIDPRRG